MRNMKFWHTALVATLVLTVMLSVTGGTIAWFTDTVESKGNKIEAGTLDIKLHQLTAAGWTEISNSTAPLFASELWEPGRVEYKVLKVENAGTLALKWKTVITSDAELNKLADVIDVYTKVGVETLPGNREEVATWTKEATLADFINNAEGKTIGNLAAGAEATLGIALKMREEADNQYQGLSLGSFDIKIVATQDTVESDSFGTDYDAEAEYPKVSSLNGVSTKDEFVAALASIQNGDTVKLVNDIELGDMDTIALTNYVVTGTENVEGATVNKVEYTEAVYNIDLNGHTLFMTDHVIDLHGDTLNIKNGTISMDSEDQSGTFISVGGHSPVYNAHQHDWYDNRTYHLCELPCSGACEELQLQDDDG